MVYNNRIMKFKFTVTDEDIKNYPNDYELGNFIRVKYYEHSNLKFDKCIKCGKESPYTEDTHIDLRHGYTEGIGQGCFQEKNCEE